MSELQTALLAIGFGVVVAIYAFGWWQQRQFSRKYGEAFKVSHQDALSQENTLQPVEPELPESELILPEVEQSAVDEVVATVESVPCVVEQTAPTVLDESCSLLNARSDFIIELQLLEPSPASVLDGLWQRKFDFAKPLQVCGLTVAGRQWERAIAEGQTLYVSFKISLQLVDRSGAVSMAKLADFRDLVLGIAKNIKADSSVPELGKTHVEALALDEFCASVDQMVGVNLVPPRERLLQGEKLAQAATLVGMTLESDGAFHAMNAQGHSLFTLTNQDTKPFQRHTLENITTAGVTLLLDVPRVENPATQFDQMMCVAHEFAKELQVNVVDDHSVLLSEAGLALIRARIVDVAAKMVENGVVPGSAQARRLFS